MKGRILVSIIIRCRNEIHAVKETIKSIEEQSYKDFELIIIDCESTDGSLEFFKQIKIKRLYQIKVKDYKPGKILNKIVKESYGDIIVFNNADCIPQNNQWLFHLVKPLLSSKNQRYHSTFARQIGGRYVNVILRKDYEKSFGNGEIHKEWKYFFSLASSAFKKSSLLKLPFNEELQYSEDIDWLYKSKDFNFQVKYVKKSIVEHRHNYTIKTVFSRFYGEGFANIIIFKEKEINVWKYFFKPLISSMIKDCFYLMLRYPLKIPYFIIYRIFEKLGFYQGSKDSLKQINVKN